MGFKVALSCKSIQSISSISIYCVNTVLPGGFHIHPVSCSLHLIIKRTSSDSTIITQDADKREKISCGVKLRSIGGVVNVPFSHVIHVHISLPQTLCLAINGLLDTRFRLLSHFLISLCHTTFWGQRKSNQQMGI